MTAGTIERAFELARSGTFHNLEGLKRRLRKEGHEAVSIHLGGKQTRTQISTIIAEAKRGGA